MTTETSELTGDLEHIQHIKDDDDDDVNDNNHCEDCSPKSQDMSTTIATTTPASASADAAAAAANVDVERESTSMTEQNEEATEEAVFINHGFVRWEKARRGWLAPPPPPTTTTTTTTTTVSVLSTVSDTAIPDSSSHPSTTMLTMTTTTVPTLPKNRSAAIPLDVDEIIDLIFSQRWRSPDDTRSHFPQPVPLPQMVDILVDLWEAEGLDI